MKSLITTPTRDAPKWCSQVDESADKMTFFTKVADEYYFYQLVEKRDSSEIATPKCALIFE